APNRMQITFSMGNKSAEIMLEVKDVEEDGLAYQEYRWLRSILQGHTLTWAGGLSIPTHWKVGEAFTALSEEGLPATANRAKISLTLDKIDFFTVPSGSLFPHGTQLWGIEIHQTIQDVGLGTKVLGGTMTFAGSLGLVSAVVQIFGPTYALELDTWSGAHSPSGAIG